MVGTQAGPAVTPEARCHEVFILGPIEEAPDVTLAEIGERLAVERGVRGCALDGVAVPRTGAASRFFKKKSAHGLRAASATDCSCAGRIAWLRNGSARPRSREDLIFHRSEGPRASTEDGPRYAAVRHAASGCRGGRSTTGHWKTTTFTAGLRPVRHGGADAARCGPHEWCPPSWPMTETGSSRPSFRPGDNRRDGQPAGPQR